MIDLRSDTVTKPGPGMREAIARAEVGDDVFDEDPTIHLLQERVAALLGKEAALLVPSGTMANTTAVLTHTERGDEVIVEEGAHVFNYESGSSAAFGGLQLRTIPTAAGSFTLEEMIERIRPSNVHHPRTRLVCMENTHNRAGGTVFLIDEMRRIGAACRERGIRAHLDGARLWNASVASGVPMAEYAASVDSVSVCLSKGLGAPVGSLVSGTKEFVARARKTRKMLGGGMRQAGILAAAGLYAVDHNVERLTEDHENARLLARTLNGIPGIRVDLAKVETNIVIADTREHPLGENGIVAKMAEKGVLFLAIGPGRLRLVTHLDVSRADVEEACGLLKKALGGRAA
ncbi:MAG: low-specificity L-threonine aldolase [Candidatus Eisenbacteria bacterium]